MYFQAGLRSIQGLAPKIRKAMSGKIDEEEEIAGEATETVEEKRPAEEVNVAYLNRASTMK